MAATQRLILRHAGPLTSRGLLLCTTSSGLDASFTGCCGTGGEGCAIAGGEDVGMLGRLRRWEISHSDSCAVGPGARGSDDDWVDREEGLEEQCILVACR